MILAVWSRALRRDAAAVEADAAELGVFIDERDFDPVVGGVQGGRVSAGAAADDQQLRFANVGHEVLRECERPATPAARLKELYAC